MTPIAKSDRDPIVIGMHQADEGIDFDLLIPDSLYYFRGHFRGFPILPGIVQLDWAIRYGRDYLQIGSEPPRTLRVKFVRPIGPGTHIALRLSRRGHPDRLSFGYHDEQGPFSSGLVGFAGP